VALGLPQMKKNGWYRAPVPAATAPNSGEGSDGDGGAEATAFRPGLDRAGDGLSLPQLRAVGQDRHGRGIVRRHAGQENLEEGKVKLPKFTSNEMEEVTMKELGLAILA